MKTIQASRPEIEAEFEEPLRDVLAGFIAQGESLSSISRILEVDARSVRSYAKQVGISGPARTANTIGYRSSMVNHRRGRTASRGLLEYTPRRRRVLRGLITYQGRTMAPSEWADVTGINRHTIRKRISRGWTVEKALTTKPLDRHEKAYKAARSRWSRRP